MQVGSLRVRMNLRQSRSLKDKRQVVRSILDRMRAAYEVAAAEVGDRDDHQIAILGFTAVAEEAAAVQAILENVRNALRDHPVAAFVSAEVEVLRFAGSE